MNPNFLKSDKGPLFSLLGVVLLTMGTIALANWGSYQSYRMLTSLNQVYAPLERLSNLQMKYDEVLVSSALLAASTKTSHWEQRYRDYAQRYRDSVKEMLGLLQGLDMENLYRRTDQSADVLFDLEKQAFELIANNQRPEAMELLQSASYIQQRQLYLDNMAAFREAIRAKYVGYMEKSRANAEFQGFFLVMAFLVLGFMWIRFFRHLQVTQGGLQSTLSRLEAAEAGLKSSNESLASSLLTERKLSQRVKLLAEMDTFLHLSNSKDELAQILTFYPSRIFASFSGAIYLLNNSGTLLNLTSHWGDTQSFPTEMKPEECWSLRTGLGRLVLSENDLSCEHHPHQLESFRPYICTPLEGADKLVGMLYLVMASGNVPGADDKALAESMAHEIALAHTNRELRLSLKRQAIRDPLTNLYNRRFMDETLAIEVAKAIRGEAPLAVMMFDVDHFKRFNDEHGHEAGDLVLQELGQLLGVIFREGDICCRYGGEEFAIVLPKTNCPTAKEIAERLLQAARTLRIEYQEKVLPHITVSIGIACLPEHAKSPSNLIRVADEALYAAKREGRNQVSSV